MTADFLTAGRRYHQAGDLPRAEAAYRLALQLQPANAQLWYLLGALRQAQGKLPDAIQHYGQALRLQPRFGQAQHDLGVALVQLGRSQDALHHFQEAVRLQPNSPDFHRSLGGILRTLGRFEEATMSLRQSLSLRPESAETHNSLGKAFRDQRRFAEAEAHFRAAVGLRPELGEAYYNLGTVLLQQKRLTEAEASCREAVRLLPRLPAVHNNLGAVLLELDRLPEALACFQHAAQLDTASAEVRNNLGNAFRDLGRFDEALAAYAQALLLKPDFAEVHWNAALVHLLRGNFEEGWPEYEWLWRRPEFSSRVFAQPRWDGSPLAGRTILLFADHGLGDTIQFIRYAHLVREQGARVIVECPRLLLPLLGGFKGVDLLVAQGDPLPPHDWCAPLMGLPLHFRTTSETIPATVPYLHADAALVEQWRRELAARPGFKIGITWQGNPDHVNDRRRSIPLMEFASLAAVQGVQLVSLQHGPASQQLAAVSGRWPITDLGGQLDDVAGPFMDRAAVMKNLDLVVACDTSIAHLAGALGVPVWVALPQVPDWRWLLGRDDSLWYPTMRLFRQERRGEWGPVFQRMADAVQQFVSSAARR